jgi:hypothetical protein
LFQVTKSAAVKKVKRKKSRNGKVKVVSFPFKTANPLTWQHVVAELGPRPNGRVQVHADGSVTIHNNANWIRR